MKNKHIYHFCQLIVIGTAFMCTAQSAHAQPSALRFPLQCTLGENCWVVNYVDHDPAEGAVADYTCGPRSYDALQGTEIAVRDRVALERGVDVFAVADGTILRIRDGIEDKQPTDEEMDSLRTAHKGCGNGVVIDHGEGWQSVYCHLRHSSITVVGQQKIKAGDKIAQLGQSGAAEFPQLYYGLFFEGQTADPFSGLQKGEAGCAAPDRPLWREDIAYVPAALYAGGFSDKLPDFEAIKADASAPSQLPPTSDPLVFWAGLFGAVKGDQIHLEVRDPANRLFVQRDLVQDETRARQFYYAGREVSAGALPPGDYTGTLRLTRPQEDGTALRQEMVKTVHIE